MEREIFIKFIKKVEALNPFVESDNFKDYSATFKRVANIVKILRLIVL